MKKLFLFFFASLLSISMFAAGETGKTKGQAIPYNWTSGIHVASDAGVGKWYVVNLLKDDGGPFNANGKTDDGKTDISISVVNPLSEEATVDVVAYIGDNETSRHFTLAAGGSKAMTFGAGMFVRMGISEVYLYLVMDVTVTEEQAAASEAVNVNVQTVESNAVSFVPVDFVWGSEWGISTDVAVGNDIPANKETWVKIDRTGKLTPGWTFKLYVQNMGSESTTIYGGLATDCPATNIQEQEKNVGTGSSAIMSKELDLAMLDMMPEVIYIRLKASQPLHVWAEQVEPTAPAQPLFDAEDAIEIAKGTEYPTNSMITPSWDRADSIVYKAVYYPTLVATSIDHPGNEGKDSVYYVVIAEITNNGSTPVTLTGKVVKNASGAVNSAVTRTYTIQAGQTITKKLDKTLLSSLETEDEVYCLLLGGNSNVKFLLKDTCLEESPCVPAQVTAFTWNVFNDQAAGTTKWYSVDIADAKSAKADIVLTMNSTETANIDVDVAVDCAIGEPTQSYSGSSTSTTKTLSYSLFKDNEATTIYVRVKTNKAIKVKAELLTAIVWNGSAWVGGTPDLTENAARIEGDLTIHNGETIEALGITLAGGIITIEDGGKLIVGKEGFKGSNAVDQIVINEGGVLLIDPAATTNNKPFVTAKKTLVLGNQEHPNATLDELHEFIALPIENREAGLGKAMRYVNWDRKAGWVANDGFRNAFVGYNVFAKDGDGEAYADHAQNVGVSFKGQLAPNQSQTLNLPMEGWYAFGNSWTAPIALNDIYSQLSGSGDEAAVHFYVATPHTYGTLGEILDNYYIPATADIASQLGITEIAPMQGFFLYTASGNNVTLNYNNVFSSQLPSASPAPKRVAAVDNRNKVAVVLNDGIASDFVYMIEGEATNAHKMIGNKIALYAEDGLVQVANDNLIGTILTIQTTEATEYTIRFTWLNGETMYLKDLVNGNIIAMSEDSQYSFTAEPNTVSERFQVIGRNDAPTGMENNAAIEGANKRIENGKVVIIKNGVKYDVLGAQL